MLTRELGVAIVGDDLFTTNTARLQQGLAVGAANTMLLKVNQIGTISEAFDAVQICYDHGYGVMPCDSRGEGANIADYAVGLNTGHLREGGSALVGLAALVLLIPVVMFYLLQDWPQLVANVQAIIPRPMLPRTLRIFNDIDSVLSQFLRGQLSVMLLLAVFYSVGLWLAGLKFALPVGVITGLLVFIPYIGFGGGLVLAILTALLQADGWSPLIGVAIVYGLGQAIESFVLTPYLVGERIGLHPVAVIFALMAFGQLFGFVGVLVALPASAAILVGLRELRAAWLTSRIYRGDTEPRIEETGK